MKKLFTLSLLVLSISLSAFADAFDPSTNLNFSNITSSSISLNWTAGGGNTRIVIARKGSLPAVTTSAPEYSTSYAANSNFNLGAALASGKVVYYGAGSAVTVSGLEASSQYFFTIIEVEENPEYLYYATNEVDTWKLDGNTNTGAVTAPAAPTVGASALNFTSVTTNALTLNWTKGNGTHRIVVARKGSAPSANPSNYQYYAPNPVFGSGNPLGNGFVVYNGTGSSVNVTGLEEASTYYFSVIEYNQIDEEIILYANSLKTTSSTSTNSTEPISEDSDEDGVNDEEDEYPQDAHRAFNTSFPAAGFGTLMFEDLWPGVGDYDFNDLVLNYRYNVVSNAAGKVVEVKYTFVTRAIGGSLHNGFAFQLDGIPANRIASVSGTKTNGISYATFNNNGTEANQTFANIIVIKDAFDLLTFSGGFGFINVETEAPNVGTDTTLVIVKFLENGVSPTEQYTAIEDFTHANFNPYLIVGQNRGKEVHMPNRVPSSLVNAELFGQNEDRSIPTQGRYYKTDAGLPWALEVTESIPYATEKTDFTEAFLKFASWASSGGTNFTDWYLDLPAYRNSAKIYSK